MKKKPNLSAQGKGSAAKWIEEIRQKLKAHTFKLKKYFGQNLLLDAELCESVASACPASEGSTIVEVGSGPGNLTVALLAVKKPKKLIALEKDTSFLPALYRLAEKHPELQVVNCDALDVSISSLGNKLHVVGNLPYYIATKLLTNWLEQISFIESITATVQLEVAERICAAHNTEHYSSLSVLCQSRFDCKKAFVISADSFIPKPKVESATIRMRTKQQGVEEKTYLALKSILACAFSKRRKKLSNSVPSLVNNANELFAELGIDINLRPQALAVEQYLQLAQRLK